MLLIFNQAESYVIGQFKASAYFSDEICNKMLIGKRKKEKTKPVKEFNIIFRKT